jgi:hypothetical protein
MTKEQLIKTLIKPIIKRVFDKKEKTETFGVIKHFPQIMDTLEQLMGPEYKFFIKDIAYIAPKPTTFKIILLNDQYFFLTWYTKTFQAQVSGKKYYLLNLSEQERATLEIVELLKYKAPGDIKSGDSSPSEDIIPSEFEAPQEPESNEPEEEVTPEDLENL